MTARLQELESLYEAVEVYRVRLVQEILREQAYAAEAPEKKHGADVEIIRHGHNGANHVVKITVQDVGYIKPRGSKEQLVIQHHWRDITATALADFRFQFTRKLLVLIDTYFPFKQTTDHDNRQPIFKGIIDGIRYATSIPDDNFRYLEYWPRGEVDKNFPRTEIFLIPQTEEWDKQLELLGIPAIKNDTKLATTMISKIPSTGW